VGALGRPRRDKVIGIELQDEHYSRLVIEVDDPEREIARIREAVATLSAD
jgi:hypothetical protein